MTNLNKLSKDVLIEQYNILQKQNEQLNLAVTNTVNVANYFGSELQKIDNFIMATPFKTNVKSSFFWVVANWATLAELVNLIIEVVKEVKRRIEELKKQQEIPNEAAL